MITAVQPSVADVAAVRAALEALVPAGQVFEVRALEATTSADRYPRTHSGYFDSPAKAAAAVGTLRSARGVYFTPNPVNPALLARANNRLRAAGKGDPSTADHDVTGRRFLLVDADAVRPSGISSTDDEHAAALERIDAIAEDLANEGWPLPIRGDSGNGGHAMYLVDLPQGDGGLVAAVLSGLAQRYSDDAVKIDTAVFNPARIWKLYGTLVAKGDDTPDRPHRMAKLLSVPEALEVVTADQLRAMAVVPEQPKPPAKVNGHANGRHNGAPATYDGAAFVSRYLDAGPAETLHERGGGTGTKWVLNVCPFNSDHTDKSAVVMQMASGAMSFRCHHNGCDGNDWDALRARFDPKPDRQVNGSAPRPRPAEAIPQAPSDEELGAGRSGPGAAEQDPEFIFDPDDPRPTARRFTADRYSHRDGPTLWNDGDAFLAWDGSRYAELADAAVRAEAYEYLEPAQRWAGHGDNAKLVPFAPNRSRVDNVMDAVRSLAFTARPRPSWLCDPAGLPEPSQVLAASNGLVHLRADATARLFRPPTPLFYSPNALDYPFDAAAPAPRAWLEFLTTVWPDDREAIDTLQEWAGYILTADTRQQKALLLVGPKRAGKGTIARVLSRLIGLPNVCGPTLAGLGTNFGLWPLLGKLLAIVSDARLSGRTDQAVITERILALTGEDAITVDRKNREPVTVRVPARLMILTNELPKLADASGALASRFVVLILRESFIGREDTGLEQRITREMPGILLWAVEGWRRLQQRGRFVQPASSADAVEELNDLASPIAAFVKDWCQVRRGLSVPMSDLFEAWQLWCREQGNNHASDKQVFGRDLRASVGGLGTSRSRDDGTRFRLYDGIDLTLAAKESVRIARDQQQSSGRRAYVPE
jgi:putative DNA primase/helicase